MREGLRSGTVSEKKRDRSDSTGVNILPDLNAAANPSQFGSVRLNEEGYAGDGRDCKGTLAEYGVVGFVADESVKSKGVDTEGNSEVGIENSEQEVVGQLRNSVANKVDLDVAVPDCDDLGAGEEKILEKYTVGAINRFLKKHFGSDADTIASLERYGLIEHKTEMVNTDGSGDDGQSGLQSRAVVLGGCSENLACVKGSFGEGLDTVSQKRGFAEKDTLQADGEAVLQRVAAVTTEGQASGGSSMKKDAGFEINGTEVTGNVGGNENFDGENKRNESMDRISLEDEDILMKAVVHGDEDVAEEVKVDDNNGFFDAVETFGDEVKDEESNAADKDGAAREVLNKDISEEVVAGPNVKCKVARGRGRPRKHKGGAAGVVLNNTVSNELPADPSKCKAVRGRGRPRKHFNNVSVDPVLKNIEDSVEDKATINQEGNNLVTDHTGELQNVSVEMPMKRKRGRPRKIEKGSDVKEPNQYDLEGSSEERVEKQDSPQFVVGSSCDIFGSGSLSKPKRGRGRPKKLNLSDLEGSSEKAGERVEKQDSPQFVGGSSCDKFGSVSLSKPKRGRGRPKKLNLSDQEGSSEKAGERVEKQDSRQFVGGSSCDKFGSGSLSKPKRGRGRPKKLNLSDQEGSSEKAGERVEKQDSPQFVGGSSYDKFGSGSLSKPKRGRGRPKKLNLSDQEGSSEKAGERVEKQDSPQFVGGSSCDKFGSGSLSKPKRGRGRPRKIDMERDAQELISQDQDVVMVGYEDTLQSVEGTQAKTPSYSLRLKRKRESTGDASSVSESNMKVTSSSKCSSATRSSKREEKNTVRQQIVDMLISAGWTVEHKPRQGSSYADSVYRCPEGRTCWSVTLAYRVLKRQVETGKAGNFCFTPIPEEKLSKLFRVSVKERSDKNKPKEESPLVESSGKRKEEETRDHASKQKPSSARSGEQNRRGALLVRGSGHRLNSAAQEFMSVSGKHSILSWMIGCGVIPSDGRVLYCTRTEVLRDGSITKDGIYCNCCSKLYSVAQFEAHAGFGSSLGYQNLYLDNGTSLLQCQMDLWNKQEESIRLGFHKVNVDDDPNDDTCGICGDGGNLICCDGCPSTFHQACLNILTFPSGDWHCVYCSCKYCGTIADGEDQDNVKHGRLPSLLTCCLCDGKYHLLCAYEKDFAYDQSSGSSFCGKNCEKIYKHLQQLVGVRADVGDGYTCTFIKRSDSSPGFDDALEPKEIENRSKLDVALSIMDECFLPIIDYRSGINMMRHTFYSCGSNFKRLNFRGFFTAILEKEDEMIAAACIRIHGKEVAEMPFIGTRDAYRRQGMCRRLLSGIERALHSLAIEKLVIPAVSEVVETWTSVFGFEPLGLGSEMRRMNILVFPGVDMLQKPLSNHQVITETTSYQEVKDTEQNGLIESKAEDARPGKKVSSEGGSFVCFDSASVDQEKGKNPESVYSDTAHSAAKNNPSTFAKDENRPAGTYDQVVISSEEPVLERKPSLAGHDAYLGTGKIFEPTICSKLKFSFVSLLENGVLCDGDDPFTSTNNGNNPDEIITDLTCPVMDEAKEQSSATDGNLLLVPDDYAPNGAKVNSKATQFSPEKSCNMDSSSKNLGSPGKIRACSASEVGFK